MPSRAFTDLGERLKEIDVLMEAHEALTRLHRAHQFLSGEARSTSITKTLNQIAIYLQKLVQDVGRGRPPEVQALSRAAVALLSAHLQGYLVDLHAECARLLFGGKVANVESLITEAPSRGNPTVKNISRLFASLGFEGVLDGIHWRNMSNKSVKARLREINELRNRIVHGAPETVHKVHVTNMLNFVRRFTCQIDNDIRDRMSQLLGGIPW